MNKSLPVSLSDLASSTRKKLFDDDDSSTEEEIEPAVSSMCKTESLEKLSNPKSRVRKDSNSLSECTQIKPRQTLVDHHPLEAKEMHSSLSEDDADDFIPKRSSTPASATSTNQHGSNKPGWKKMQRLHNFIATNLDESHDETQSYYSTASTLWNHRGKLFNTVKKQVASQGWSFSHHHPQQPAVTSTASDVASITDKEMVTIDTSIVTSTTPPGSRSMPSISSYDNSDDVVDHNNEQHDDTSSTDQLQHTSASSFLHELRTKVPNVFIKKQFDSLTTTPSSGEPQQQTPSSPALENPSTTNTCATPTTSTVTTKKRADSKTSSFAVSLSSLLQRKSSFTDEPGSSPPPLSKRREEELGRENSNPSNNDDVATCSSSKVENQVESPTTSRFTFKDDVIKEEEDDSSSLDSQIDLAQFFLMTLFVFFYLVAPLPSSIYLPVRGFMMGVFTTSVMIVCLRKPVATKKRAKKFRLNRDQPEKIPPGFHDLNQPVKGWMNEIKNYQIETYHVSSTTSVFVTIDNDALRIQTPLKNISRRGSYKEGKVLLGQVLKQRIFDLNHAEVFLQPEELVAKRIWSKKYPICVKIKNQKKSACNESDQQDSTASDDQSTILYLFGRTCRQKEEWFYKIQQAINLCRASAASSDKTTNDLKDEWQILNEDDDDPVQTCLHHMNTLNEKPQKILQDYYLQMTRLLPEVSNQCASRNIQGCESADQTKEKDTNQQDRIKKRDGRRLDESDLQVSWMNVLVGRIMFDFLRQPEWTNRLFTRVQKKLDKIKLPYFVSGLKLIEMNLGSSAPLIHQISLPRIDKQGIWVEAEVTYHGSFQMTLETYMMLTKLGKNSSTTETQEEKQSKMNAIVHSEAEDSAESTEDEETDCNQPTQSMTDRLVQAVVGSQTSTVPRPTSSQETSTGASGQNPPSSSSGTQSPSHQQQPKKWVRYLDQLTKHRYYKKITETEIIRRKLESISHTPVLLTVELVQLHGVVTINIPPPPTDRIWYGFREPPEIELKAFPKVGEKIIKVYHVTELIEQKLKQEFIKLLVMPNMEDLQIPLLYSNRSHR